MDSTSMEDFWCEVESIKESSENGQEEQTLLEVKPADGEHTNTGSPLCVLLGLNKYNNALIFPSSSQLSACS